MSDHLTVKAKNYATQVERASRYGSHPDLVKFEAKFRKELNKKGIPMYPHCFLRDDHTQARLKAQGRSKAGPGQSPHNWGCAVDIVHSSRHWNLTEKEWAMIGAIGKEVARKMNLRITWGGDWEGFWDPAHWELADWRAYRGQAMYYERRKGQSDQEWFKHLADKGGIRYTAQSQLAA